MNAKRAVDILGMGQPLWAIRNMARALSIHAWGNTAEENERLAAARYALRHRKHYLAEIQKRLDAR